MPDRGFGARDEREAAFLAGAADHHFFGVAAGKGRGKTTALRHAVGWLQGRGVEPGGFLQPAVFRGEIKTGYDLHFLCSEATILFAWKKPPGAAGELGFEFEPKAWEAARNHLIGDPGPVIVLDELGRLEAEGKGHWPALVQAVQTRPPTVFLFGLRRDCLDSLQENLGRPMSIFAPGDWEALARTVLAAVRERPPPLTP